MIYRSSHDVEAVIHGPADFDRGTDAGKPLLGRYLLPRRPGSLLQLAPHPCSDAMLQHLLLTDGTLRLDVARVSDEDFRRYLSQMRDLCHDVNPDDVLLAFKSGFARVAPSTGGILMPVASGLLLPPLARRPNDRPIVIRSAASEPASANLLSPTMIETLFKDAVDDVARRGIAIDAPEPTSDTGATTIDLSAALTACLADDRGAQPRTERRRGRTFGKLAPWAVAAALALALVPAVRWQTPTSRKVAVGAPAPLAERLPAPAIRVASQPAQADAATRKEVPPAIDAPQAPALEMPNPGAPVREAPLRKAMVEPVVAPAAKIDDRRADARSANVASAPAIVPAPKVVPRSMVSMVPQPATVSLTAEAPPQKAAAGRPAKRKTKRATSGKPTNVASVLVLPDVLKPQ